MPRIVIAECKQEVSSFNPVRSNYDDFVISRGEEILDYHRHRRSEIGGALSVFSAAAAVQVGAAYEARQITSAGPLAAPDFRRIATELLASLAEALPVDGVFLSMHGAMAADGEPDPEGFLLEEARRIVGARVPIVVSLDLHGIITDRMLTHSDAVVMFHTYPHVDFWETGARAARLLLRIVAGEVRPVTAKVTIPALVRGDELLTETGLFGQCLRVAQAMETSPGGLVAGYFIGNPFTDVPELGSASIVVTDGDPARAEREALQLAELFWPHRARMQAKLTSVADAVREAATLIGQGTVALVDAADAPSSGASGDSNVVLRELLRTGYRGRALIPIVDPGAVRAAEAAGIGGTVRTTVGGARDPRRFTPVSIEGRVRLLSDGHFLSEAFADEWYSGRTAVIAVGSITLVVTSRPVHLFDRALFHAHGQDPQRFDLVVVKSPNPQRRMYRDWCKRYIHIDATGSTSARVETLGHVHCPRPMFPLDPDASFTPRAKLFSRSR